MTTMKSAQNAMDELDLGIHVHEMTPGVSAIIWCYTGEVNTHDLRPLNCILSKNVYSAVIEVKVPEKDVRGRLLYIVVDFGEQNHRNTGYQFTTSTTGVSGLCNVGDRHDPNHRCAPCEMKFEITLDKLTGDGKKILQLRRWCCFANEIREVLIDFIITVIPEASEAPDKVTDKMLADFAKWLVEQNIYEASNELFKVGCYSQKDLEELTLVDIDNLDLKELTKRKLLKLKGCRDCALLLETERDRKRRQSAVVSAGSAREGDSTLHA